MGQSNAKAAQSNSLSNLQWTLNEIMLLREDKTPADRELRSKLTIVKESLEVLLREGQEGYILACKQAYLRKLRSGVDTAVPHGPSRRSKLDKEIAKADEESKSHLAAFESAKQAFQWLHDYYDLCRRRASLMEEMHELQKEQHGLAAYGSSQHAEQHLAHLRKRLAQFKTEIDECTSKANKLRDDSLTVGLGMCDRNHSGFIEPEDMPELSPEMFARIDVHKRHKISSNDLIQGVHEMQRKADELGKAIREERHQIELLSKHREQILSGKTPIDDQARVQAEEVQVQIQKKIDRIEHLERAKHREEDTLHELFSFFHRGFGCALFRRLELKTSPVTNKLQEHQPTSVSKPGGGADLKDEQHKLPMEDLDQIQAQLLRMQAEQEEVPTSLFPRLSTGQKEESEKYVPQAMQLQEQKKAPDAEPTAIPQIRVAPQSQSQSLSLSLSPPHPEASPTPDAAISLDTSVSQQQQQKKQKSEEAVLPSAVAHPVGPIKDLGTGASADENADENEIPSRAAKTKEQLQAQSESRSQDAATGRAA